jgi:hypothetical protein
MGICPTKLMDLDYLALQQIFKIVKIETRDAANLALASKQMNNLFGLLNPPVDLNNGIDNFKQLHDRTFLKSLLKNYMDYFKTRSSVPMS